MADNSATERPSSPPRKNVRKGRALWWTGGAVVLIGLAGWSWLADSLLPLGLGAGALLALAILWEVPKWQVRPVRGLNAKDRFDRENEARKTLAQILGGVLLLSGIFGSFQSLKLQQFAQESARLAREGQLADRFTKAIEQLGAVDASGKKKLEVRLGGIYALEGIANESVRDHWPIMEVLCTYVRVNAPAPSKGENPLSEERKPKKPAQDSQASAGAVHPASDIQAILTVLGRRNREYEREAQYLDLRDTNLRGADVSKANIFSADLRRANLADADLSQADLSGAHLESADLSGADLSGAHLSGADLSGADLSGADLSGANLRGANLSAADLRGADLRGARYLTQEQIDAALGDSGTKLPKDEKLRIPDKWKPGTAAHENDNRRQPRLP